MKFAIVALVFLAGCATAGAISQEALPKIGVGLQASEDLYHRACEPEPMIGLENVCPKVKTGINDAVTVYTEVNDAVK
jgi:hypothetical protein